jgi:hypothetical protein
MVEIFFSTEAPSHTFTSQGVFQAALLTRLEIHGVLLDLFDDGFLLDLPFEPLQRLFDRLAFVDNDICH